MPQAAAADADEAAHAGTDTAGAHPASAADADLGDTAAASPAFPSGPAPPRMPAQPPEATPPAPPVAEQSSAVADTLPAQRPEPAGQLDGLETEEQPGGHDAAPAAAPGAAAAASTSAVDMDAATNDGASAAVHDGGATPADSAAGSGDAASDSTEQAEDPLAPAELAKADATEAAPSEAKPAQPADVVSGSSSNASGGSDALACLLPAERARLSAQSSDATRAANLATAGPAAAVPAAEDDASTAAQLATTQQGGSTNGAQAASVAVASELLACRICKWTGTEVDYFAVSSLKHTRSWSLLPTLHSHTLLQAKTSCLRCVWPPVENTQVVSLRCIVHHRHDVLAHENTVPLLLQSQQHLQKVDAKTASCAACGIHCSGSLKNLATHRESPKHIARVALLQRLASATLVQEPQHALQPPPGLQQPAAEPVAAEVPGGSGNSEAVAGPAAKRPPNCGGKMLSASIAVCNRLPVAGKHSGGHCSLYGATHRNDCGFDPSYNFPIMSQLILKRDQGDSCCQAASCASPT